MHATSNVLVAASAELASHGHKTLAANIRSAGVGTVVTSRTEALGAVARQEGASRALQALRLSDGATKRNVSALGALGAHATVALASKARGTLCEVVHVCVCVCVGGCGCVL